MLVSIPFTFHVVAPFLGLTDQERFLPQLGCLSVVPVVLVIAILRGGFARTARIEELGRWLGAEEECRPSVRDALADALADPSLQLLYPGVTGGLVDGAGRETALRRGAWVRVGSAVIAYDDTLIADPSAVEQAGRVVALALERERLTAALLARSRELRKSRSRLVEVADEERRRVAQDLHDTLQGRLVLATLRARWPSGPTSTTRAAGTRRPCAQS